jgi:arylsulfate sulfotransferase
MKLIAATITGLLILSVIGCSKKDASVSIPGGTNDSGNLGTLVIPNDSIKINPYGYSPLAAMVNYTAGVPGKTKIVVKGKNGGNSDITHQFDDYSYSHSVPVIGLYADYENTVDIFLTDEAGNNLEKAEIKIVTGDLPGNLPVSITVNTMIADKMQAGMNLVSNYSNLTTMIPLLIDNYGDIRWLLDYSNDPELSKLNYDCGIARLRNGNYYFGNTANSKIYEVNVLGKVLNSWSMTGYAFHHNVIEKPNGNFVVSVSKTGSTHTDGTPTIEDYIVEIDRTSGAISHEWDLKELLNEYRTTLSSDPQDWIHVNGLVFDSTDNTIIVSGRVQGLVKLTYDNTIKWIMGPHKGWGTNREGVDLNQFLLNPLDAGGNLITDTAVLSGGINHADFEWNWYQHCPSLIPNGDLMIFDNGTTRNYNAGENLYSRAAEFKIDPVNMTVQQVWTYGKERGLETFSSIVSSVQFLPAANHILFSPGYEVINDKGKGGKIVEVDYESKEVVFEMSVCSASGWGWHRVARVNAYP